jgi:lipopolysaccharide transport system permease protein
MPYSTSADVFRTDRIDSILLHLNPWRMVRNLCIQRHLIWPFTLREITGRYKGSYLGLLWAIINPLMLLAVYTFVFHYLLPSSNSSNQTGMQYALYLYSGMIAYNIFSEPVSRSPALITQNINYVKKVVFPLEILPPSLIGSALFHGLLSVVILLLATPLAGEPLHWTIVLLPVICVPLALLTAGVCWLLASLGVFLRDIGNVVTVGVQLLFFLTPIVYPPERLATRPWASRLMMLNPMATVVDSFRRVVNEGLEPNWGMLAILTLVSLLVAACGYAWFMKIKRAFADVI